MRPIVAVLATVLACVALILLLGGEERADAVDYVQEEADVDANSILEADLAKHGRLPQLIGYPAQQKQLQTDLSTITGDAQLEIAKAREQKQEAIKASKAARAAKGIAKMVSDSARKLIGTIGNAKSAVDASEQSAQLQAVKEKEEAAAAMDAAKAEVKKAKQVMSAAKSQAIRAKKLVGQYLASDELQKAQHDYSERTQHLQEALAKEYGGNIPKDTGVPPALKPDGSLAASEDAQVQQIGQSAADEVIKKTFGSWGAEATANEMQGIPKPAAATVTSNANVASIADDAVAGLDMRALGID